MAICNSIGEACHDPRIQGGQPVGAFKDEAPFSQTLRYSDEPARREHKIVLTHADLNPRNTLVECVVRPDGSRGWEVTGIVDWKTSGYYPEYWDYTKAVFEEFRGSRRYTNMIRKIFAEFGVEKRSWESGGGAQPGSSYNRPIYDTTLAFSLCLLFANVSRVRSIDSSLSPDPTAYGCTGSI